jgi:hypothetical protein
MKTKADAYVQLNKFVCEFGIPEALISDNAGEELGGEWE